MIRLILTGVAVFAGIVLGYKHFAAASPSGPSSPAAFAPAPAGSPPAGSTGSAPSVGLSAAALDRLKSNADPLGIGLLSFIDKVTTCGKMGGGHWTDAPSCSTVYRVWAVPFGRAHRDAVKDISSATGACKAALLAYMGRTGLAPRISRALLRSDQDAARNEVGRFAHDSTVALDLASGFHLHDALQRIITNCQ